MREEIKIWASKYSWSQLSEEQRKEVLLELTQDEYVALYRRLQNLKTLEQPDQDVRAAILARAHKKKKKTGGFYLYVASLAAMLILGYFIGGLQLQPFQIDVNAKMAVDTVYKKQTDTVQITKYDTIYKTEYKNRTIVQKVKTTSQKQQEPLPSPVDKDYKVPAPKDYTLELPRMEKENTPIPIDFGPEEALPLSESLGRPQ